MQERSVDSFCAFCFCDFLCVVFVKGREGKGRDGKGCQGVRGEKKDLEGMLLVVMVVVVQDLLQVEWLDVLEDRKVRQICS